MRKSKHLATAALLVMITWLGGCAQTVPLKDPSVPLMDLRDAVPGNMQVKKYLPLLKDKRVAVLTNASGKLGDVSLVDTLLKLNVDVKKVFVPEHGFRGEADAGVAVDNTRDKRTGLPVVSLYGKNKKPTSAQLADIDVVLYDIQDLGVRFYTYISTMSYAMEACAENGKHMVILDRPNPNGFYIDGPVLEPDCRSFLGLHPVPVVYGMTCGEYAQMVNGEGWLANGVTCSLSVIPMTNYKRNASYRLPVKPSPNIPNEDAVLLYPGLGLFEGTVMSLGRGTDYPFQVVGHPEYPDTSFGFTPVANEVNKKPRYAGQRCYGIDLRESEYLLKHPSQIGLAWLIKVHDSYNSQDFFEKTFDAHAGNKKLREQITQKLPEEQIRQSWEAGLTLFRKRRAGYLLYEDLHR